MKTCESAREVIVGPIKKWFCASRDFEGNCGILAGIMSSTELPERRLRLPKEYSKRNRDREDNNGILDKFWR